MIRDNLPGIYDTIIKAIAPGATATPINSSWVDDPEKQTPLLKAEEEVEYANQIQAMLPLLEKDELTLEEQKTIRLGQIAKQKSLNATIDENQTELGQILADDSASPSDFVASHLFLD